MNLSNFIKSSTVYPFVVLTFILVFNFLGSPAFSLTVKKAKKHSSLRSVPSQEVKSSNPPVTPATLIAEEPATQTSDEITPPVAAVLETDTSQKIDPPGKQNELKDQNTAEKQDKPKKQNRSNNTFNVSSDQMIARRDNSLVEFSGNVKVTRLDSVLTADSVIVYFDESNEDSSSDAQGAVKKIISSGDVEYVMEEKRAYADKAVYTAVDEILILTGNPARLQTGDSFVTGQKITLFRTEDRVLVEGQGNNRVQALFNPEDKPIE